MYLHDLGGKAMLFSQLKNGDHLGFVGEIWVTLSQRPKKRISPNEIIQKTYITKPFGQQ